MGLIKALVGGITSFFKILFGGLLDTVKSAFGDGTETPVMPAAPSLTNLEKGVEGQTVSPAASELSAPEPIGTTAMFAAAMESTTLVTRPRRRPGASMSPFMAMAQDMSTKRA